jgi:hypothetical protein
VARYVSGSNSRLSLSARDEALPVFLDMDSSASSPPMVMVSVCALFLVLDQDDVMSFAWGFPGF